MKNNQIKRGISKSKFTTKTITNINPKIEEIQSNIKEKDSLQIKDQSPLLYNRRKETKTDVSPIINNEVKSIILKNPKPRIHETETKTDSYINNLNDKSDKDIENEQLKKKVSELEKELNQCKSKLKEKDSIISEKDRKILELETKYREIKSHIKKKLDENEELAFALERIHQMEVGGGVSQSSNSINHNNPFGIVDSFPSLMNRQLSNRTVTLVLSNLANRMLIVNDMVMPLEQQMLNEVGPNPDTMTYEQLLELQEKIGYVDKGFKKEEVEKLPTIKFSKFRSSRMGYFLDK